MASPDPEVCLSPLEVAHKFVDLSAKLRDGSEGSQLQSLQFSGNIASCGYTGYLCILCRWDHFLSSNDTILCFHLMYILSTRNPSKISQPVKIYCNLNLALNEKSVYEGIIL